MSSHKMLLCGLPRTGKTTAMRRLCNPSKCLRPNERVPSTCFEKPRTVELYHRTEKHAVMITSVGEWKDQNLEQQGQTLYSRILKSFSKNTSSPPKSSSSSRSRSSCAEKQPLLPSTGEDRFLPSTSGAEEQFLPISKRKDVLASNRGAEKQSLPTSNGGDVLAINRVTEKQSSLTSKNEGSSRGAEELTSKAVDVLHSPSITVDEQSVLTSLVKAHEWSTVRKKIRAIEDVTTLYVMDCGGHPECHEILPLLIEGPALNLIFLNLTHKLDEGYNVQFQGEEGLSSIKYESTFTVRDVLQRILCSISSLQSCPKPVAMLVGSYLDETNLEAVHSLDKSVQEALRSFFTKGILFPVDYEKGKYIATLDNMSEDQGDIEELRRVILTIIETRLKPELKPIPTAWLLFHLLLRHEYEKQPGWCTVKECVEVAKTCGIEEKDLLKEDGGVLRYIHENYGTLLYYPKVPGLCNRVVCDPNVILRPLTRTIIISFACKPGDVKIAEAIRKSGEIPRNLMETVCATGSKDHIPTSEIVDLLKDRYILYESDQTETKDRKYFMPCLLQPDPSVFDEASNPNYLLSLNPAPLQLVPEHDKGSVCGQSHGYVPLGLFPALVVKMSHVWLLKRGNRYKNRIRFIVIRTGEQTRTVELRQHADYLELRLLPKEEPQMKTDSILISCRQQLWDSLHQVSSQYPHMKDVVWQFGFYCPGGLQRGEQPHSAICLTEGKIVGDAPVDMQCFDEPCCEDEEFLLETKHKRWFKVS